MIGRGTGILREAQRRHRDLRREIGADLRRLREDAGATLTAVAAAAGIDRAHLLRIERGDCGASVAVLNAVSLALGARLSIKAYPDTGPRIRDRHQAAMIEAVVALLHPRWRRLLEVAVRGPARGYIDLVLADTTSPPSLVVAAEAQSEIRRVEQQLRWATDKAESLTSAAVWPFLAPADAPRPIVSRLLILRSTASTRELMSTFPHIFEAAYPARTADVYRSLRMDAVWPGPGIVWVRLEHGMAQVLAAPPRGVRVGR